MIRHKRLQMLGMIGLALAAGAFEYTRLDILLQDQFFDFANRAWIVDGRSPWGRLIFYNAPKVLIGTIAVALLGAIVGPDAWRRALSRAGWKASRVQLVVALIVAALVPISVGELKRTSGVFCPSELTRYGGTAPYRRPFSLEVCTVPERGHCWPAGHASGGFALIGLSVLTDEPRARRLVVLGAMGLGWAMGLYQMLKGAHFMSHTLFTLLLATVAATVADWLVSKKIGLRGCHSNPPRAENSDAHPR